MCRGGGGNKIRLRTKGGKKKYNLHFTFFPLTFENVLSVPHVIFFFFFASLISATPGTREGVAVRGAVAPRRAPTWRDPGQRRLPDSPSGSLTWKLRKVLKTLTLSSPSLPLLRLISGLFRVPDKLGPETSGESGGCLRSSARRTEGSAARDPAAGGARALRPDAGARTLAGAGRASHEQATGPEREPAGCKALRFAGPSAWRLLVLSAVAALP